jgi:quinolinate synthase
MIEEILRLKKEKNAVILSHHYQSLEIKEVSDFVGDSLELSKIAAKVDGDMILLCGVHFMAETAKMLAPDKRVFLPNAAAGCPMADMVTIEKLLEMKAQYPDAVVVTYVNSSAAVKSVSDICCTSSNAVKIVRSLESNEIIFVPDQNLGQHVLNQCPEKVIHLWKGFCPTHHRVTRHETIAKINEISDAVLFAHPECRPDVLELADFIGSTAQIIEACKTSLAKKIIIGTEQGVVDTLKKILPEKEFFMLDDQMVCKNMKKTTLEDVLLVLKEEKGEILVDLEVAENATKAIIEMIERS